MSLDLGSLGHQTVGWIVGGGQVVMGVEIRCIGGGQVEVR